MALTYYHSSKMGPHISFDISTIDGSNFHSNTPHPLLFYFHPLLHSFFLLPQHLSLPTVLFSDFLLSATSCYQSLLPLSVLSFFLSPTFCHFALLLPLTTSFSPSFLTFMSHLMAIFLISLWSLLSWAVSLFLFMPPYTLPLLVFFSIC